MGPTKLDSSCRCRRRQSRVGPTGVDTGAILQLAAGCLQSAMALVLTTTHEAPATVIWMVLITLAMG